jgi:predicted ABC-type ATPase
MTTVASGQAELERAGHWKHEWIPLDFAAAKQKYHNRIPPYWHAPLQDRPDRRSGKMQHGDWHMGHQAVSPAPAHVLGTERSRYVTVKGRPGKHHVTGSYSDPWWMTQPGGGWAVSRRWQHKAQTGMDWHGSGHRGRTFQIPAADERVITPVDKTGVPLPGEEASSPAAREVPTLSAAAQMAEARAKASGAHQYVTETGAGHWRVSGERPVTFKDHFAVDPEGNWTKPGEGSRRYGQYVREQVPLKGRPVATRAGFDPAKHPRGYHGRWATTDGKAPWHRSGDVVTYHNHLGINREDMPQVSGMVNGEYKSTAEMLPKFLGYLKSRGINVHQHTMPAAKLRPTQTTGSHKAIRGIADQLKSGEYGGKRITVSQDDRVMDGHHNWAGTLLANSEGHKGGQQVLQVGLPARELLAEMRAFAKREGIASRKTGEHVNPKYANRTAMIVPGAELEVERLSSAEPAPRAAGRAAPRRSGGTEGGGMGRPGQVLSGPRSVARGLTWDPGESAGAVTREAQRAGWDPAKHPRVPGGKRGGEFAKLAGQIEATARQVNTGTGGMRGPRTQARLNAAAAALRKGDREAALTHLGHAKSDATGSSSARRVPQVMVHGQGSAGKVIDAHAGQVRAAREPAKPLASAPPGKFAETAKTVPVESVDTDTVARYRNPDGTWKPDRQALHDQIVSDLLDSHKPQANPVMVFMGGGSASGKSTTLKPRINVPDAVTVDADAIKEKLPDYQAGLRAGNPGAAADAHEESSYLTKLVTAEAQRRKMNVLVDGVGDDTAGKTAKKITAARQAGYRVNGAYVTLDTEEAVRRSEERGRKEGRVVYPTVIRANHAGVSRVFPELVQGGLFDSAELWDNNVKPPVLIGTTEGGRWQVRNRGAWQQFLAKGSVVAGQ